LVVTNVLAQGGTLSAPTNVATLFTAGASGSRVDQIRINQTASTTAIGLLNIFIVRGGTSYLWDVFTYGVVTLSNTVEAQPVDFLYNEFVLKTGDTLTVGNTLATATGGLWALEAVGGDF
jgi:hypothetical protein